MSKESIRKELDGEKPTLETILCALNGFKREKFFKTKGTKMEDTSSFLTKKGQKLYSILTSILYAVGHIAELSDEADMMVGDLDETIRLGQACLPWEEQKR